MLTEDLKEQIQANYRTLLKNSGYQPRVGQRLMIAQIANTLGNIQVDDNGTRLGEAHVCAIEAGTGTGKTVAYMLAALPIAMERSKTLVVSTATVILQEQLMEKDLPDLSRHVELPFSYAIAKGRGRYMCTAKLMAALSTADSQDSTQYLFEDEREAVVDKKTLETYKLLASDFSDGEWDGDRDSISKPLSNQEWAVITTDHNQCTNRRCQYFTDCSYFVSRQRIADANVVVANHDLVMADLSLGGGVLLSEPNETIYVFDEAHHLPDKALNHFNAQFRLEAGKQWLSQLPRMLGQILAAADPHGTLDKKLQQLPANISKIEENLSFVRSYIEEVFEEELSSVQDQNRTLRHAQQIRFPEQVDKELSILAGNLALILSQLQHLVTQFIDSVLEQMKLETGELKRQLEMVHARLAATMTRLQRGGALWQSFVISATPEQSTSAPPMARWLNVIEQPGKDDYEFWSSPVLAADLLSTLLWQDCYGAVLTSATLTGSDQFARFRMRTGLPAESVCKIVPSPFKYHDAATLSVPKDSLEAIASPQVDQRVVEQLETLIDPQVASLVIFTSRRQLQDVLSQLSGELQGSILSQDDYSRQELIKQHKARIDNKTGSVIFGLSSVTEGIDLPGDYLSHVIIVKLPFSVPNNPIEATLMDWLKSQGKDPFWEVSVPDATIRLKQACGRLLRSETDQGKITLLDRRILTKRYGRPMLDALPDFKRQF